MTVSTQLPTLTLTKYLSTLFPESKFPSRTHLLHFVLPSLLNSLPAISSALSRTSVTEAGSSNDFGDAQLNVDVLAEDILREACAACESVVSVSSEEDPVEKPARQTSSSGSGSGSANGESKEQYTIAFDPLDGSSIIGPNWTVGTILGIWDGPSALSSVHTPREKQIGAILGVLGPRTCAVVALRLEGAQDVCFEVTLNDGVASVTRPEVRLKRAEDVKTRYFAPANLRAASENPAYLSLINSYIAQRYTLRYSGGLVPDIFHALVKGHGIYISPVTEQCPAKLRRLYELAPVALVVECAGGEALDSKDGSRVLDRAIQGTDERGGLVCGSTADVEEVRGKLLEQ